jgi:hypothetical protein
VSNLKLVPDDPTPLEKLLLDASRAEAPSEDHKARMRAVLGIGLPMSGPLAAPPPVTRTAASIASPPAALSSATAAKVALGVGALALLGALWFSRQPSAPQPAPPVIAAAPALAPVAELAVAQPEPEVSPLPPAEPVAARARTAPPAASAADDLSEQIRLIEAARAGVAAHSPGAALSALDSYSAKFPRGSFGQEAMVLRIRAVDQAGDSARATALAKSFVARFPKSPHVARLKPIAERGASR